MEVSMAYRVPVHDMEPVPGTWEALPLYGAHDDVPEYVYLSGWREQRKFELWLLVIILVSWTTFVLWKLGVFQLSTLFVRRKEGLPSHV